MIGRAIILGALIVAASLTTTSVAKAPEASRYSDLLFDLLQLIETEHLSPPSEAKLVDHTLVAARRLAADGKPDFDRCVAEATANEKRYANAATIGFIPICLGLREAEPDRAETVFAELAKGMLSATGGRQEYYVGPADLAKALHPRASVGLSLRQDERGIIVVDAKASTPAGRAGIKKGDRLIAVDNVSLSNTTLNDTIEMLRGEPGSSITLALIDTDGNKRNLSLYREKIVGEPAMTAIREGDRLMVSIHNMSEDLPDLLAREIAANSEGIHMLILDLRGNTGGFLESAVEVADSFLGKSVIAIEMDRSGARKTIKANRRSVLPGTQIFVLVDEDTASGAELLAAALVDNGRGRVIGRRTAGVGTIRTVLNLDPERAVMLTTGSLLRPNGAPIEKAGVTPDCEMDPALFDLSMFEGCFIPSRTL